MPIILPSERRAFKSRIVIGLIYLLLILGGATMVYPFLITVSSSLSNRFEYNRFLPMPRSLIDRSDRFVRSLVAYFFEGPSATVFQDRPASWSIWSAVGSDREGAERFAAPYLDIEKDPVRLAQWRRAAVELGEFQLGYDIRDTTCNYDPRDVATFLQRHYERRARERAPDAPVSGKALRDRALTLLKEEWGIPYASFFDIEFRYERLYPMHHPSWDYPDAEQARLYLKFKDAYRRLELRPGTEREWTRYARRIGLDPGSIGWPVQRDHPHWPRYVAFVAQTSPASPTLPFLMKEVWLNFLNRREAKEQLGLDPIQPFTVADYNRLFAGNYPNLVSTPFPVPPDAVPALRDLWNRFVETAYPRRLMTVRVTPELTEAYRASLRATYRTIAAYNTLAGTAHTGFENITLAAYEPTGDWRNFVSGLPASAFDLRSSEAAYQAFLLERYGSLDAINEAYGWSLKRIEEAAPPLAEAMAVTFFDNEWKHFRYDIAKNFQTVFDFLAIRGRAFVNTVIYISIAILLSLTINPLAAYALSRFKLRFTEQILLFLIATMAFPGAVTAIPSFLLLRDLQLLNTFYALFLPTAANGMAIFILKCFFDGLPRELYEAATIDGAKEWQIFVAISLPMTTPILAINALNAFIAAYNSWEWALLVCQKESYWTIAVWLYQLSQTLGAEPWIIAAGFVAASIPTAAVFIGCQKIILRGIVIPSMK